MLVAFTGLSGAGKTTAANYLAEIGAGLPCYAGELLRQAVHDRGLPLTPDNERNVRAELRKEYGMDVFALRAIPIISDAIHAGHVVLDAIYNAEERERYRDAFPDLLLTVAIEAGYSTRSSRLVDRPDRPLSPKALEERDAYERETLHLGDVISAADKTIVNEGTLSEFQEALSALIQNLPA